MRFSGEPGKNFPAMEKLSCPPVRAPQPQEEPNPAQGFRTIFPIEYFAANCFPNSGCTMQNAANSSALIAGTTIVVGDGFLGHGNGKYSMLAEAFTVFPALIGATWSCMNTAARVTYAMARDREAPEHLGILHGKSLTPRRAIWTLAFISAIVGVAAVPMAFYRVSPALGLGTFKEPLLAFALSAAWGICGAIYSLRSSQASRKPTLLTVRPAPRNWRQ